MGEKLFLSGITAEYRRQDCNAPSQVTQATSYVPATVAQPEPDPLISPLISSKVVARKSRADKVQAGYDTHRQLVLYRDGLGLRVQTNLTHATAQHCPATVVEERALGQQERGCGVVHEPLRGNIVVRRIIFDRIAALLRVSAF